MTGRSGGGAYSWWIAAIDERIKVAVPVAGITDLQNHVVDGCVEGHCDCMFMVNTYRWDYPQVAALVAPRPLLIANTDRDGIFPLDGVVRTFDKVRRIYRLYDATKGTSDNLGLNITRRPAQGHPGAAGRTPSAGSTSTSKATTRPIDSRPPSSSSRSSSRSSTKLPADQINTKIHEIVRGRGGAAGGARDKAAWQAMRDGWRTAARREVVPAPGRQRSRARSAVQKAASRRSRRRFTSPRTTSTTPGRQLRLYVLHRRGTGQARPERAQRARRSGVEGVSGHLRPAFEAELKDERLPPANAAGWESTKKMFQSFPWAMATSPARRRPTALDQSERKQIQNRRRFYLLGPNAGRACRSWDVRRAIQAAPLARRAGRLLRSGCRASGRWPASRCMLRSS